MPRMEIFIENLKSKMKTQIKLDSVGPNGIGGPETEAINLIYGYLFSTYGLDVFYSYIHINHITSDDLNEIVIGDGKEIYCNVRFPEVHDIAHKPVGERNRIRLDILHEGLLRIAKKKGSLILRLLKVSDRKF